MRRLIWLLSFVAVQSVYCQEIYSEKIRGLRVFGKNEVSLPVASLSGDQINIEMDIEDTTPPDIYLKFYHCDRNWEITNNLFINDPARLRTYTNLPYRTAPDGVQYYRYQYDFKIPSDPLYPQFTFSGNYLFEVWEDKRNALLAQGKFFVVEKRLQPMMRIRDHILSRETNPRNQTLRIDIGFSIPKPDSIFPENLYPMNFQIVDIYRNREIEYPKRIDVNDRDPETFVDGMPTKHLTFTAFDIQSRNEYRKLDLRNVDDYPPGEMLRPRLGADVSRFLQRGIPDNDGAAYLRKGDRYGDYLPFQFEFVSDGKLMEELYIVGDFNGWRVSEDWKMTYSGDRYILNTMLRRGVYDYQYVIGGNDWVSLEGNDWRTISNYTAFVYYRDIKYGGFDRILGVVMGRNDGSAQRVR